jgi:hypothetical protein
MKRLFACTFLAAALLGTADPGLLLAQQPPSSPREAFERAKAALGSKDWGAMWDLLGEEVREEFIEKMIAEKREWRRQPKEAVDEATGKPCGQLLKMSWKELFAEMGRVAEKEEGDLPDPSGWSCIGEKVEGEKGKVLFRDGKGRTRGVKVVREGEGWVLADGEIFEGGEDEGPGREEVAAIAALKSLCTGEEQFRCAVCIDANANGEGEYGFLSELAGTAACRGGGAKYESNPFIPASLGAANAAGVVARKGYCFVLYLPTGEQTATAADGASVSAPLAEKAYIAYAWPLEKGATGNRAFAVDPKGEILCRESEWSGAGNPPPWDAAYKKGEGWSAAFAEAWKPFEAPREPGEEPPGAAAGPYARALDVYKKYLSSQLDAAKQGKTPNARELMDQAAKAGGFKDWTDFTAQSTESIGSDGWTRLSKEVSEWYQKEVDKWTKEIEEGAKGK